MFSLLSLVADSLPTPWMPSEQSAAHPLRSAVRNTNNTGASKAVPEPFDPRSIEAVNRIYEIKGRKHTSPLAICVGDTRNRGANQRLVHDYLRFLVNCFKIVLSLVIATFIAFQHFTRIWMKF
ncbi:hypothetical protein L1887_14529 [Cichorium endivia]|nr:hypothetical protein L1887_14529 [Cichorium endivia]